MSITLQSVAYIHGPDDQIEQVLPELVEAGWEIESRVDDFCCLTMESQHVPDLEFLALENRGLKCVASTHDCHVNYLWHQSVAAGSFLAAQRGFGRVEPQGYGIQEFHRSMLSGRELPQRELCELVSLCSLSVKIPDLVQLTLEEARLLSKHVGILSLPALKTISPEVARELVKHAGLVELDGLEHCSPALAEALMTGGCGLSLGGLTSLTVELAQIFSSRNTTTPERGNTGMRLAGLAGLNLEAARALNKYPGCLSLGCPTLTAEVAQALVAENGYTLTLSQLTELPADLAAALSEFPGDLRLPAVESLCPEAAKAIASHRGDVLALNGVRSMSPEVAQCLAGHRGTLGLYGLKRASQDVLDALKNHDGPVVLGIDGGRTLRQSASPVVGLITASQSPSHKGIAS
jgi:hypothetical protein